MIVKDKYTKKSKAGIPESPAAEYIEMADSTVLKETPLDKVLKLSIILGILIISLSIYYHLIIFTPKLEMEKISLNSEVELARLKSEKEVELIKLKKGGYGNEARVKKLKECLNETEKSYEKNWAKACMTYGIETREENCTLPRYHILRTEKLRTEGRDVCLKLYGTETIASF